MQQALHTSPAAERATPVWMRNEALALLFLANTVNLFDRQIVNVLSQSIKMELNLSDAMLGLVTGTAFGLLYAGLGIPLGRIADKVNRVKLISAALIVWSAFTSLVGFAANFIQLFMARVGVGVGQAAFQPAATALVADLFPPHKRTSALSLMLLGIPAGSFLGLFVGGAVGSHWGWRTALIVAGTPGLLLAVILFARVREPRPMVNAAAVSPTPGKDNILAALGTLARAPGFMWLILAGFCVAIQVYASGAWLPPFFIRVFGMSTAEIGRVAALAVGVGGALGTFGAGFLCDLLRPHVRNVETKSVILTNILTVPTLLVTVFSPDRTVAAVAMFLLNIFAFAYLGPLVILIQAAATPKTRALAIAFTNSVANIASLAVGLPLIGLISDHLAPSYGPRAIGYALCVCTMTGLLGALAIWRSQVAVRLHAANP